MRLREATLLPGDGGTEGSGFGRHGLCGGGRLFEENCQGGDDGVVFATAVVALEGVIDIERFVVGFAGDEHQGVGAFFLKAVQGGEHREEGADEGHILAIFDQVEAAGQHFGMLLGIDAGLHNEGDAGVGGLVEGGFLRGGETLQKHQQGGEVLNQGECGLLVGIAEDCADFVCVHFLFFC